MNKCCSSSVQQYGDAEVKQILELIYKRATEGILRVREEGGGKVGGWNFDIRAMQEGIDPADADLESIRICLPLERLGEHGWESAR